MARKESLIAAYILDGNGGGRKIGWDDIETWSPEQGVIWVHLDFTTKRARQWLSKKSRLDALTVKAMIVDEARPRAVFHNDGLMVFLRGINLNPGQDPEDMVSLRLWLDRERVITTRRRKLLSIEDMCAAIESGVGPKNAAQLFRMLNDRLIDRMAEVLEGIEDQVDHLDEEVMITESHLLRPKIADVRRQLILIRRYLAPQREALNRLYLEDSDFIPQVERSYIREAADRVLRFVEECDSARDRAAISQEELSSRLSEQMDRRMYVLSVVAVIFLPLTFITGLLGINVGGIPGAEYKNGFLAVCMILLIILMGMLWVFHRKKWM